MQVIDWLHETIPQIQLQGDRINIVGFLWLVLMGSFTYTILKQVHPWKDRPPNKQKWIFLFNIVASFLVTKFIHQYIDNFFMIADLLSGHADMISHSDPEWNWTVFGLSWSWLFMFSTLTMQWFYKVYDLKKVFRFNWITVLTSALIIGFWTIHLSYYPYDYAVTTVPLRLIVFWQSYVPLYLCYGIWYVSIWKDPKGTPRFPLDQVKAYYLEGEHYDWVQDPRFLERIFHRKREQETMKVINLYVKNSTVLDVGCGTGLITRDLHGEVLGIDINEWNLERALVNAPYAHFMLGDCEDMDKIVTGSIDTAVFTETLEHLPDPKRALREIRRVLKDDGKLIVSVPSNSPLWRLRKYLTVTHPHSEPFHHNYSERAFRKLLLDTGFEILETRPVVFGMILIGVCERKCE